MSLSEIYKRLVETGEFCLSTDYQSYISFIGLGLVVLYLQHDYSW